MRAQALKRLAFIVLSSELGQYQAQLPDIQGEFNFLFNFKIYYVTFLILLLMNELLQEATKGNFVLDF